MSARPASERWDLGGRDLDALLAEARARKGESLWSDAWRRLRRNRAALHCLRFVALVALLSLFAPLLPLPSPMAIDLKDEPQPPEWPWEAPSDATGGRLRDPGVAVTRSLRNLANDGWQHRTIVRIDAGESDGERARELVERLAGLRAVVDTRPLEEPGRARHHVAVPGAADVRAAVERALGDPEASEIPAARLDSVSVHTGYWPLGVFDGALVALRARVFGLWQTGNWLGTDSKGRDLLARIVFGSRTSILVALAASLCSLVIGVTYGAFSGLAGGRTDNLMMRVVDVLYAIPFIFIVIFLITIVNEYRTELADVGIDRMHVFYAVIGAIYWLTMARVVRGQVLSLKHSEFIEALRVMGASTPRILFLHLVPNVLSIVIVYLTLTIPAVMLFEAFLSFLGLGVEPPQVSWGLLAVDGTEGINALKVHWWLVVFPAVAMGSTLLALNVLGDGLRDALDPKMRGLEA